MEWKKIQTTRSQQLQNSPLSLLKSLFTSMACFSFLFFIVRTANFQKGRLGSLLRALVRSVLELRVQVQDLLVDHFDGPGGDLGSQRAGKLHKATFFEIYTIYTYLLFTQCFAILQGFG